MAQEPRRPTSCLVGHADTLWAGPPSCAIIPGPRHSHVSPRERARTSDVSALPSPPALGNLVPADLFWGIRCGLFQGTPDPGPRRSMKQHSSESRDTLPPRLKPSWALTWHTGSKFMREL